MKDVIFEGWEVGMRKIPFSKLLSHNTHLTLKESRTLKDEILDNKIVKISFETEEIAKLIVEESIKLGVKCKLYEDENKNLSK